MKLQLSEKALAAILDVVDDYASWIGGNKVELAKKLVEDAIRTRTKRIIDAHEAEQQRIALKGKGSVRANAYS